MRPRTGAIETQDLERVVGRRRVGNSWAAMPAPMIAIMKALKPGSVTEFNMPGPETYPALHT